MSITPERTYLLMCCVALTRLLKCRLNSWNRLWKLNSQNISNPLRSGSPGERELAPAFDRSPHAWKRHFHPRGFEGRVAVASSELGRDSAADAGEGGGGTFRPAPKEKGRRGEERRGEQHKIALSAAMLAPN